MYEQMCKKNLRGAQKPPREFISHAFCATRQCMFMNQFLLRNPNNLDRGAKGECVVSNKYPHTAVCFEIKHLSNVVIDFKGRKLLNALLNM